MKFVILTALVACAYAGAVTGAKFVLDNAQAGSTATEMTVKFIGATACVKDDIITLTAATAIFGADATTGVVKSIKVAGVSTDTCKAKAAGVVSSGSSKILKITLDNVSGKVCSLSATKEVTVVITKPIAANAGAVAATVNVDIITSKDATKGTAVMSLFKTIVGCKTVVATAVCKTCATATPVGAGTAKCAAKAASAAALSALVGLVATTVAIFLN